MSNSFEELLSKKPLPKDLVKELADKFGVTEEVIRERLEAEFKMGEDK